MGENRVTLSDLARSTGLAVSTVSTVLSGKPGSRTPAATAQRGLVFGLMSARRIESPQLGGLPAVIVNGIADGVPAVLPDEERAGREAIEHLVSLGHRRIALIGRSESTITRSARSS